MSQMPLWKRVLLGWAALGILLLSIAAAAGPKSVLAQEAPPTPGPRIDVRLVPNEDDPLRPVFDEKYPALAHDPTQRSFWSSIWSWITGFSKNTWRWLTSMFMEQDDSLASRLLGFIWGFVDALLDTVRGLIELGILEKQMEHQLLDGLWTLAYNITTDMQGSLEAFRGFLASIYQDAQQLFGVFWQVVSQVNPLDLLKEENLKIAGKQILNILGFEPIEKAWNEGRYGYALGRSTFEISSAIALVGGVLKVTGKAGKIVQWADKIIDETRWLSRLGRVKYEFAKLLRVEELGWGTEWFAKHNNRMEPFVSRNGPFTDSAGERFKAYIAKDVRGSADFMDSTLRPDGSGKILHGVFKNSNEVIELRSEKAVIRKQGLESDVFVPQNGLSWTPDPRVTIDREAMGIAGGDYVAAKKGWGPTLSGFERPKAGSGLPGLDDIRDDGDLLWIPDYKGTSRTANIGVDDILGDTNYGKQCSKTWFNYHLDKLINDLEMNEARSAKENALLHTIKQKRQEKKIRFGLVITVKDSDGILFTDDLADFAKGNDLFIDIVQLGRE